MPRSSFAMHSSAGPRKAGQRRSNARCSHLNRCAVEATRIYMQTRGCRRGLRGEAPTWSPSMAPTATSPGTWNSLRSVMLGSKLIYSTSNATTFGLSEVGTTCAAQALLAAMPLVHLPSTNIHLRSINQQDPQQRNPKTGMEQRISDCCNFRRKALAPRVWTAADGRKAVIMGRPFSLPENELLHTSFEQPATPKPLGNMRIRRFTTVPEVKQLLNEYSI